MKRNTNRLESMLSKKQTKHMSLGAVVPSRCEVTCNDNDNDISQHNIFALEATLFGLFLVTKAKKILLCLQRVQRPAL